MGAGEFFFLHFVQLSKHLAAALPLNESLPFSPLSQPGSFTEHAGAELQAFINALSVLHPLHCARPY